MDTARINYTEGIEYLILKYKAIAEEYGKRIMVPYYRYDPAGIKHLEFHQCTDKVKGLIGANRSAKTRTVIQEVQMLNMGEHPYIQNLYINDPDYMKKKRYYIDKDIPYIDIPNKWWWISSSRKKIIETDGALSKWKETLPMNMVKQVLSSATQDRIIYNNGSEITFKSLEEDLSSFTAAQLDGAIIDERIKDEEKRQQIRMRTLDKIGRLYFTMDALDVDYWLEELVEKKMAKVWTLFTEDNKYISKKGIEQFKAEMGEETSKRLLYGDVGQRVNKHLFPREIWNKQNFDEIQHTIHSIDKGTGEIYDNDDGDLKIFKEPLEGISYLITVDVAEGHGGDDSVGNVWRTDTKEQVAIVSNNIYEVIEFSKMIYNLAKYYNRALIAPEDDKKYGRTLIDKLLEYQDSNLFMERKRTYYDKVESLQFGVKMYANTKGQMVQWTYDDIKNNRMTIHDSETYKQLLSYVHYVSERGVTRYKGRGKSRDDKAVTVLLASRVLRMTGYIKSNEDYIEYKDLIRKPAEEGDVKKFFHVPGNR